MIRSTLYSKTPRHKAAGEPRKTAVMTHMIEVRQSDDHIPIICHIGPMTPSEAHALLERQGFYKNPEASASSDQWVLKQGRAIVHHGQDHPFKSREDVWAVVRQLCAPTNFRIDEVDDD